MSENKFQNRYRIPSARAIWHNYNSGCYFVTICTQNRKHYFGKIIGTQIHQMILSPIGKYTDEQFRNVHLHYPYAEIPIWVVMPNHVHAIVVINHDAVPHEKRIVKPISENKPSITDDAMAFPVGNVGRAFPMGNVGRAFPMGNVETFHETSLQRRIPDKRTPIQIATEMQSWLSVVVRQTKQSVTRFAKQNHIPFAWQTRYHDHIIRNADEMNRIANYIEHNVDNW